MGRLRLALVLLPLAACFSALLEAPYVLSTGLGESRGVCPSPRLTLLVASSLGLWEVDGEGKATKVLDGDCSAVTSSPREVFAACDGQLTWGALPAVGERASGWATKAMPGVRDVQAWCDGSVLIGDAASVTAWDPTTGETSMWAGELPGLRSLALGGGDGCEWLTVVTADQVLAVTPTGKSALATGLVSPRAAAVDRQGRQWVLAGQPAVLSRMDGGKTTEYARYLGDPRDLQFGMGGLLPPSNGYLPDGGGTLDYVYAP